MVTLSITSWVIWWCTSAIFLRVATSLPSPDHQNGGPKLLYILIDGFRWDYVEKQSKTELPNFNKFLADGVRARWTNPLFPSLSYPSWTSLTTGQYAETHGVVGNNFYDAQTKEVFSLFDEESTGKQKWWTSEPIWTTAEKAGLKTAQFLWGRCDVPIDGVRTHHCEHYVEDLGKDIFLVNIMNAIEKFDQGYDFVQVYTSHTDYAGHDYGPDSHEVLQSVKDLDVVIGVLLEELMNRKMAEDVNIVLVSDHGMASSAPGDIARHEIDDYINTDLVENIAEKGAFMNIKVPSENIQEVYEQLSAMSGVHVYKKDEIPEELHYKKGKYVNDILIIAKESNYIMGSHSNKQLPPRSDNVSLGVHGYIPDLQTMKGIFFAKGPAFNKGKVIDPIHVVDVYQVLAKVLNIRPQPHNGTWEHVVDALASEYKAEPSSSSSLSVVSPVILIVHLVLIICLRFL